MVLYELKSYLLQKGVFQMSSIFLQSLKSAESIFHWKAIWKNLLVVVYLSQIKGHIHSVTLSRNLFKIHTYIYWNIFYAAL